MGIGTAAPVSQLANTAANTLGSDGQGTNAGTLAWAAAQTGYAGTVFNGQTGPAANGLAVKVAGTAAGTTVLDVSAGAAQGTAGTALLAVKANGAVSVPGTLAVGGRLSTGPVVLSVLTLPAPTGFGALTVTAGLVKLFDNGSTANGTLFLSNTGVLDGQTVLVTNLDHQAELVGYGPGGLNVAVPQYSTARFVFVGGFWTREL